MMNVKEIVAQWLKQHGQHGLVNTEAPCGCFLNDLMPCGEIHETECQAGHKLMIEADEECLCDESGTKHLHIVPSLFEGGPEEWVCECGEVCDPCSSKWRWNGQDWEHHHGYPIGHVAAGRRKNAPTR